MMRTSSVPKLTGVLLVLLAPCVDYVIVFAGLAGADTTPATTAP